MFGKKKKKFACDHCNHLIRMSESVFWCNYKKQIMDGPIEVCEDREEYKWKH